MKLVRKYWPTLLVTIIMLIMIGIVISYNKATASDSNNYYKERCLWLVIEQNNAGIEGTPSECKNMTEAERTELTEAIGLFIKGIVLP